MSTTLVQVTSASPFVFICAGNSELASLSANSTGTGSQAVGVWLSGPTRLTHVNVQAQGASGLNTAVVTNYTGSSTFTDVELTAMGGADTHGLENQNSSAVTMRGGTISASGGSSANLTVVNSAGTVSVAGSQLASGSVFGTVTCAGVYDGAFAFFASTCP